MTLPGRAVVHRQKIPYQLKKAKRLRIKLLAKATEFSEGRKRNEHGSIPPIAQRLERRNIISAKSSILRRFSLTSTKIFVYCAGQSSEEGTAVRMIGTVLGFGIEYSDF